MIKALLLIFEPITTWDRIAVAQRKLVHLVFAYLLPLLLLGSILEGYGLVRWGKPRGEVHTVTQFSIPEMVLFEIVELVLWLVVVFVGGQLIKSLGETFHGRHSFTQAFTVSVYGMSPLFVLRLLDVFQGMSLWVTWGLGVIMLFAVLYHGVPRVMNPDPPHAFGLYLTSCILLATVSGLARFLMVMYIQGKFMRLNVLVTKFTGLHF